MNKECVILCGGIEPKKIVGKKTTELKLWDPHKNIELKIKDIAEKLVVNLPLYLIDLLEIASYIYAADQAITRGGSGVRDYGKKWRRNLHFFIPVREPAIWSSENINSLLRKNLGFLSDDYYKFTFTKLKDPPTMVQYLTFRPEEVTGFTPEEVILFSGGLDSLGGAIKEAIVEKRNTILVSHRSAPKIVARQRELAEKLKACSDVAVFHVPVWIYKKDAKLRRENTQRTRTFLYASLAAVVARIFNLWRVRFYENGITSINLPISPQVIGARATRTTHPQVINGFSDLFSELFGKEFTVENPFLWKTKTDVVKSIIDYGCRDMIKDCVSCSNVMRVTTAKTHCGECSQCIDRRFATLAAGCTDKDDPKDLYSVDLLTGKREVGESRTMIESYFRTIRKIKDISDYSFFAEYPESMRAVDHIKGMDISEAARKIGSLYRKHANQVSNVLAQGYRDHAGELNEGRLPDSCLLMLAIADNYKHLFEGDIQRKEYNKDDRYFQKRGATWLLVYNGIGKSVLNQKGMEYIAYLMRYPNQEIHSIYLLSQVEQINKDIVSGSAGKITDAKALENYNNRLKEIEEERNEALELNNIGKIEKLEEEKEIILSEIRKATGLDGQIREVASDRERIRKKISKAIHRAFDTIKKEHEPLYKHLSNSIKIGEFLLYSPDQPITWFL